MQASATTYKHTSPTLFYSGATVVDYYGADNDNYVAGEGFCCGDNNLKTKSIADDSPNYEKLQYYYHSDHLGSASYITNLDGEVVQHIEYVPFGEVFLEERNNTWNTPFLFNGKELDEETGLYYYGARYYNPRISLWYGVDPLAEKYPAHSPYCYTMNNPVMLVDPDGREVDWVQKEDKTIYWDDNAINQSTTKEGEAYLGKEGFDLENHYNSDGTISPSTFGLDEVSVSGVMSDHARTMSNPIVQSIHRGQNEFLSFVALPLPDEIHVNVSGVASLSKGVGFDLGLVLPLKGEDAGNLYYYGTIKEKSGFHFALGVNGGVGYYSDKSKYFNMQQHFGGSSYGGEVDYIYGASYSFGEKNNNNQGRLHLFDVGFGVGAGISYHKANTEIRPIK